MMGTYVAVRLMTLAAMVAAIKAAGMDTFASDLLWKANQTLLLVAP